MIEKNRMERFQRLLGKAAKEPARAMTVAAAIARGWLIRLHYRILRQNRVSIGSGFRAYCWLDIKGPGRVEIGPRFCCARTMLRRPRFITHSAEATIIIGCDNYFGGTHISCMKKVRIGNETLLSNALIMDSHILPHPLMASGKDETGNCCTEPVEIGDKCWLGMNTIVLAGVILGAECVLSAGSMVHKSQNPCSLLMGNPARCIGSTRTRG
jgi:acetyltransferase-like isoleucine patch superfamily enzyme